MGRHRSWPIAAAALVCLLAATACGSGSDEGPGGLGELLATVPDTPENRGLVLANDYDRALALLGLERPSVDDAAAVEAFVQELVRPDGNVSVRSAVFHWDMDQVDAWRAAYGFSVVEARAELVAGAPPGELEVVTTDLAPSAVAEAVRTDPVWSNDLNELEHEGTPYFSWTDEPLANQLERAEPPRRLGQGGALAVDEDGTIVRSVDPAVVTGALDAAADRRPSLADDEAFAAVAAALDGAGVHAALLSDVLLPIGEVLVGEMIGDETDADEVEARLQEMRDELMTIPPYRVLGIGETVADDDSPLLVLVYATGSPDAAEETVAATTAIITEGESILARRPWAELLTVRESSVDGNLAVITVAAEHPTIGQQAFFNRDSLFVTS